MNLNTWQSLAVRDLYWAINSASLINTANITQWHDSSSFFTDLLNHLDHDPSDLTEWLNSNLSPQRTHRLGQYFECLWHFYFDQHPNYELLGKNLQIITPQKVTLGELDILVKDRQRHCVMHIELTVKFYLKLPDFFQTDEMAAYIGPGLKDHLIRKYTHTFDHQLPLSSSNTAKAMGIEVDEKHAIFRGRLFNPILSAHGHQPAWLSQDQLQLLSNHYDYRLLERSEWFSERHQLSSTGCEKDHLSIALKRPEQVAVMDKQTGQESRRLFLVPNEWETAAHERLLKM